MDLLGLIVASRAYIRFDLVLKPESNISNGGLSPAIQQ